MEIADRRRRRRGQPGDHSRDLNGIVDNGHFIPRAILGETADVGVRPEELSRWAESANQLTQRWMLPTAVLLPVLLIDSRLHATVLPAGYAARPTVEKDAQTPGLTISRYSGPDQDTSIEIYQGPVDHQPTDPRGSALTEVLGRLTVRGHPAVFRETRGFPDARCLVWAETAGTGVAVCSRGLPAAPLSAAKLATVAEGLVRSR